MFHSKNDIKNAPEKLWLLINDRQQRPYNGITFSNTAEEVCIKMAGKLAWYNNIKIDMTSQTVFIFHPFCQISQEEHQGELHVQVKQPVQTR